jgi:hypothetical protein
MPDEDVAEARRGGRLPTFLFWTGVGLAPVAALLLVLGGEGGSLRAAIAFAVLSILLIGVSIALRPDAGQLRSEMEDLVLDEIDMLREDVRADISSASRQTHQSLVERMHQLQQAVDVMRAELEAVRASGHPPAMPGPPPMSGQAPPVVAAAAVPAPGPPADAVAPDQQRPSAAGRAHVPTGVVRHTETVHHVTTRSTFVGHHEQDDRGGPYGGYDSTPQPAESRAGWAVPAPRRSQDRPEEESWTEQKLRERYGGGSRHDRAEPADDEPWGGEGGGRRHRWSDEDDASGEVLGPGAERTRWASRHADERAEELRLGERRAAMRANNSGTEVRIEDRWAAVRRSWDGDEEPSDGRRGWDWEAPASEGRRSRDRETPASEGRRSRDRETPASETWRSRNRAEPAPEGRRSRRWEEPAGDARGGRDWDALDIDHRRDAPAEGRRERRALPAAAEEPSWNSGWEEPAREPAGRRHRADDDLGPSPNQRRFDFELSDERWR